MSWVVANASSSAPAHCSLACFAILVAVWPHMLLMGPCVTVWREWRRRDFSDNTWSSGSGRTARRQCKRHCSTTDTSNSATATGGIGGNGGNGALAPSTGPMGGSAGAGGAGGISTATANSSPSSGSGTSNATATGGLGGYSGRPWQWKRSLSSRRD